MASRVEPVIILALALAGIIHLVKSTPTIEWLPVEADNNQISCMGRPDGYYTDSNVASLFFRCKDNVVIERARCDAHSQQQQCATGVGLNTHCDKTGDGLFTTPGTLCTGYYRCRNGSHHHFTCPPDSYFDMDSQFCVRTGGVCYELVCSGRTNGHYADTTHDCRRAYACEGGTLRSLTSCPAGTRHNGSSCEPMGTVRCVTDNKSAVAVHIQPTDPCSNLPNGYQTQGDDTCRGYYLCHSGQTIAKLRCAPGDHFNGLKCAPSTNSTCLSYCAGKPDGFTTDLRRQCRGYVNCSDGRITQELSCDHGSLFNGKSCVPALLYRCPLPQVKNVCSSLKDGYHQDYKTNCREYFYCHEGQLLLRSTCKRGEVWNGSDCVSPDLFLCQGPEVWPDCIGKEQGLYPDLSESSNCTLYHYCFDGKRIKLRCPKGLIFNGKVCVEKHSYECPQIDSDCYNRTDSYYTEPRSGCKAYYYCSNGNKLTYVCPQNLVFNGSDCVDPLRYTCIGSSNVCTNKTNGYHADEATGCHKYVYCLQGVQITTFECPENYVFDGKKCVQQDMQNCPKTAESCDSADDGLYNEPNSQCTKYFKCEDKQKIKTFTCRQGKVFNGQKCVMYICPNNRDQLRSESDCQGKIGFFQDFESNCNKYYFCISGMKTILSCKQGQVFNGEVCVSETDYTCPRA